MSGRSGSGTGTPAPLNTEALRKDFPLLSRTVNGRPIVYLDSASSALQPQSVIDAMTRYYETTHANVHRGVYATAEESTTLYERARIAAGRFIGAPDPAREVVFTKNTTESLNLVAHSWGRGNLRAGDAVLLTEMEHHSNIVPWMLLSEELGGLDLRYIPVDGDGRLVLDDLERLVDGVKVVGVSAMSNVLGTINPVRVIADVAHAAGAVVVADGAQLVPHLPVDVQALGADFLAFSAHKTMGPTGIGVLWGRAELLESMAPYPGRRRDDPRREARLLQAGRAAGALRGGDAAHRRGRRADGGAALPGRSRVGPHPGPRAGADRPRARAAGGEAGAGRARLRPAGGRRPGWRAFLAYRDVHPHDLAQVLDQFGVCVRPGHHCAKPLMRKLGVPATARASLSLFSDEHDIEVLIEGLVEAGRLFG